MLHICRIIDYYAWWERRDRYLKGTESNEPLAANEPIEQFMPWLEKPDAIASQGKRARRPSGVAS